MFEAMKRKMISASYFDEQVGDAVRLDDIIRIINQAKADYEKENMEMLEMGSPKSSFYEE